MLVAFTLVFAATAEAAGSKYPTQLSLFSVGSFTATQTGALGQVESASAACIQGRTVTFSAHFPSGRTQILDTDRSSGRGSWGVVFKTSATAGADRLTVRVTKRRVGSGSSQKTCLADTFILV